ncbi:MAG: IclR family transcriptional regulator [Actinomycetota bacterium]
MSTTLSSVRNALEILHLVRRHGPLRLSEIATMLDLSTSTAHRLTATLRDGRFLRQQPQGRRYELGPAMLFTSGQSAIEHCVTVSAGIMAELRTRTGETVHLSILRGTECVFAAALESTRLVRVTSRVGEHPPAHASAAGKVLLSELDPELVVELYPEDVLHSPTGRGITDIVELDAELRRVRERGYARNLGESEDDMYAIAVPVRRPSGEVVSSLSVAAPLSRIVPDARAAALTAREEELLAELRRAAHGIETRLAF